MKKLLYFVLIAILSIAPAYSEEGHGHGHGGHEGHGGGWGGGWIIPALIGSAIIYDLTNPYPVYSQPYPPPRVYVQPAPVYVQPAPVYAQRVPAPSVPSWYFCAAANGYYPYVTSCPSGWQTVPASPPPPR